MKLFHSTNEVEADLLQTLHKCIDIREFSLLAEEGGFNAPNDGITADEFRLVLASHEFPENNFYEYEWAIYESGYSRIRNHSTWMQLFLASLFVYCEKRKHFGLEISSDYHYLVLLLALENPDEINIGSLYLSFLEWLYVHVKPDYDFDDYYCLLTWLLLRRITNTTDHPDFLTVLDILEKRNYSTEELQELTVSDRGIESWLELHMQTPCSKELEERFENIIFGL